MRKCAKRLVGLLLVLVIMCATPGMALAAELTATEQPPGTANTEEAVEPEGSSDDNAAEETTAVTKQSSEETKAEEITDTIDTSEAVSELTKIGDKLIDEGGLVYGQAPRVIGPVRAPRMIVCPMYEEAYKTMIALKATYPEGMVWTNFEPYGRDGKLGDTYWWKGGPVKGASGGVGCAAFVFLLSDAVFSNLPARTIDAGSFTYDDVKVGDILRMGGHFVIVLQKSAAGVTVAEANYNKSVHWGRAISKAEVMEANFLVTRYPVNFVSPDEGDTDEVVETGIEGALSWTLTRGGTLAISGNGPMANYSTENRPTWEAHNDKINAIEIGEEITRIGDFAFYQSKALAIYIPDGVTEVGASALAESAIIAATMPSTVESIGNDAFKTCPNLVSVTMPEGVKKIGQEAFYGCTALKYADFPASVETIGAGAFMSCRSLVQVRFMPGAKTVKVGDNIFSQCWYLSSVTLPQTIDRISAGMFQSCAALPSIYIPASVSEIGEMAFTQCKFLQTDGIYFGGSEQDWAQIGGNAALVTLQPLKVTVHYNVEFQDPFAKEPDDPGDLVTATPDPAASPNPTPTPDPTVTPTPDPSTSPEPTASSSPEPTVSPDPNPTASSEPISSPSPSVSPDTPPVIPPPVTPTPRPTTPSTPRPRPTSTPSSEPTMAPPPIPPTSSSTTVTIDEETGTKTELTTHPDGAQTSVVTYKNGLVITTAVDANSERSAEVKLPVEMVDEAEGAPIKLPLDKLLAAQSAPITIKTGREEPVKVAIPADALGASTVVVIVQADGTETVVKTCVPTADAMVVVLPDGATVKVIENKKDFADVAQDVWFTDAVEFATARGLFAGTSATTFAPTAPMTRAMLMTVLARFDGAEISGGETWYAKAVEWAIVQGISDGGYPNQNVTREQMITMLWRYCGSPKTDNTLGDYKDAGKISGYAQEAMRWAVENGIISGFGDGRLGPKDHATRAQVAQILKNLIKTITLS